MKYPSPIHYTLIRSSSLLSERAELSYFSKIEKNVSHCNRWIQMNFWQIQQNLKRDGLWNAKEVFWKTKEFSGTKVWYGEKKWHECDPVGVSAEMRTV